MNAVDKIKQRINDSKRAAALCGDAVSVVIILDDFEWFALLDDPQVTYITKIAVDPERIRAVMYAGATVRRAVAS